MVGRKFWLSGIEIGCGEMMERLLAGLPLYVGDIEIHSPKLIQIASKGYQTYEHYITACINDNFLQLEGTDLILLLFGLHMFTGEQFIHGGNFLYTEKEGSGEMNLVINKDNHKDIVKCLKLVNCIDDTKKYVRNKKLDEKIARARAKIKERLGRIPGDEDDITFKDLVSVLTSKHPSLNLLNVWDLTYYQFNDQFKRMQLVDNYELGVRQILAGAENIKLRYYITRL